MNFKYFAQEKIRTFLFSEVIQLCLQNDKCIRKTREIFLFAVCLNSVVTHLFSPMFSPSQGPLWRMFYSFFNYNSGILIVYTCTKRRSIVVLVFIIVYPGFYFFSSWRTVINEGSPSLGNTSRTPCRFIIVISESHYRKA